MRRRQCELYGGLQIQFDGKRLGNIYSLLGQILSEGDEGVVVPWVLESHCTTSPEEFAECDAKKLWLDHTKSCSGPC